MIWLRGWPLCPSGDALACRADHPHRRRARPSCRPVPATGPTDYPMPRPTLSRRCAVRPDEGAALSRRTTRRTSRRSSRRRRRTRCRRPSRRRCCSPAPRPTHKPTPKPSGSPTTYPTASPNRHTRRRQAIDDPVARAYARAEFFIYYDDAKYLYAYNYNTGKSTFMVSDSFDGDLKVDQPNRFLFWSASSTGKLNRYDLDPDTVDTILTGAPASWASTRMRRSACSTTSTRPRRRACTVSYSGGNFTVMYTFADMVPYGLTSSPSAGRRRRRRWTRTASSSRPPRARARLHRARLPRHGR